MDIDSLFNDPNTVFSFQDGEFLQVGEPTETYKGLDDTVISMHKERQRSQRDDSLDESERHSLRKVLDKQVAIQALKDRREDIKAIQLLCVDKVVDLSRKAALVDLLNGEIISINYKLGGLV